MARSAEFHVRLAACTHNAAIEMLVHSFHGPLLMSLREASTASPLMGQRGTYEHRDLVEAIAVRDVDHRDRAHASAPQPHRPPARPRQRVLTGR